jgi:hypothetical protein
MMSRALRSNGTPTSGRPARLAATYSSIANAAIASMPVAQNLKLALIDLHSVYKSKIFNLCPSLQKDGEVDVAETNEFLPDN